MKKRLEKLYQRAVDQGHYQLASAAVQAAAPDADLDQHINVVGAMHEVGLLRNSTTPFWKAWREGNRHWFNRCLERLSTSDTDYWALAALLGCHLGKPITSAFEAGFNRVATYAYERSDLPPVHLAVFAKNAGERVLAPVLELGWDAASGETVDLRRWRAAVLTASSRHGANLAAKGNGTYYLRARLPHGSWRILDEPFEIPPDSLIAPEQTLLRELPGGPGPAA